MTASVVEPRKRVVLLMHSVYNAKFFLTAHLHMLAEEYEVFLYLKNDAPEILESMNLPVHVVEVPIERNIAPLADLRALFALIALFVRDKPDLVHTMTPKAGLLGIVASYITRVPNRIHTFQGEVWQNFTGYKRNLFRFLDWIVVRLATGVTVVSASERDFLRSESVLSPEEGVVLGAGSICGVDLTRFKPDSESGEDMRIELGIAPEDFVFLYLGRLHRDKGLNVLVEAFQLVEKEAPHPVKLLVVGPEEDDLVAMLTEKLGTSVIIRPYTTTPEKYIGCAQSIVLPSFREGFGMVLIESAAMGVPAVASRIHGITCAVVDGETGILFDVGNHHAMAGAMLHLVTNPGEYRRLARCAIDRTRTLFDQRIILDLFREYYQSLL